MLGATDLVNVTVNYIRLFRIARNWLEKESSMKIDMRRPFGVFPAIFCLVMGVSLSPVWADSPDGWQSSGHGKHESSAGERKYQRRAERNEQRQERREAAKDAAVDAVKKERYQNKKNQAWDDVKNKESHRPPQRNSNPIIVQPNRDDKPVPGKPWVQIEHRQDRDGDRSRHEHERESDQHHSQPSRGHDRDDDRSRPDHDRNIVYKPRYWEGKPQHYEYARTPWYYTRYMAPIFRPYVRINHVVNVLPKRHVRIMYRNEPYFFYSGVFYRPHLRGYIVVNAPLGVVIRTLPLGFLAFGLGATTYYYLNDVYYTWDPVQDGYVVVAKPSDADQAIAEATKGRLYIYPKQGQDEDQQSKDRYECHRWAVSESGVDPTLDEKEFTAAQNQDYRRAISACLEGRGYTVK